MDNREDLDELLNKIAKKIHIILKEKLNIPDNLIPVIVMPLGYKTDDFKPSPMHTTRKNIEELVEYR